MDNDKYGRGTEPLTPTERRRLRPAVDPAALERLIAAVGAEARRALVVHFATEVTPDDLRAALTEMGAHDELAALERGLDAVEHEPGPPRRLVEPPPDVPGAVAHIAALTTNFILQVGPPEDPVLRKLWEHVEPSAQAG
jgi:hypothetical protein